MIRQEERACKQCGHKVLYRFIEDAHDYELTIQFMEGEFVIDHCPQCGTILDLRSTKPIKP